MHIKVWNKTFGILLRYDVSNFQQTDLLKDSQEMLSASKNNLLHKRLVLIGTILSITARSWRSRNLQDCLHVGMCCD